MSASYRGYTPKPITRIFRTKRADARDRLHLRPETPEEAVLRIQCASDQMKKASLQELDLFHHQMWAKQPFLNVRPNETHFWDYTGETNELRDVADLEQIAAAQRLRLLNWGPLPDEKGANQ